MGNCNSFLGQLLMFDMDSDKNSISLDISDNENDFLSNTELEKYIVLFFHEKEQADTWCGHGVLVGDYLITVAHVMIDKETKKNLSYLYYKFDGKFKRVDSSDIVFDGRDGLEDDIDNIHHDLIIFRVKGMNSPFVLNSNPFSTPLSVYARTYRAPDHSVWFIYNILCQTGINYVPEKNCRGEYPRWDNCLLVTGDFISGNSGAPIYRQNIVYGILIGETKIKEYPFKVYNFLNAIYIQEILSRIKCFLSEI